MHEDETWTEYRALWQRVRASYLDGYCVSERGLQALLFSELRGALPNSSVVVEPGWSFDNSRATPDLVVVSHQVITDIFELKFVPQGYANLQRDIRKLPAYGASSEVEHPVRLYPADGTWDLYLPVSEDCRLHFVAVAYHDAAAVWAESLRAEVPELATAARKVSHWYGRIGNFETAVEAWGLEVGI